MDFAWEPCSTTPNPKSKAADDVTTPQKAACEPIKPADKVVTPTVAGDLKHVSGCKDDDCGRCKYLSLQQAWSKFDWLGAKITNGVWGAGCMLCRAVHGKTAFGRFELRSSDQLQSCRFHRHAKRRVHLRAVDQVLGGGTAVEDGAPSLKEFQDVLQDRRNNTSLNVCVKNIAKRMKKQKMQWCLAEGKRDMCREFLGGAESISMAQDGSKGELTCRFRAVNGNLDIMTGQYGHAAPDGTKTTNTIASVKVILKNFCTRGFGVPGNAKKEPEFDEPLETHIKEITEFIVADAASDEVATLRALVDQVFKNCHNCEKDVTHAIKRLAIY